jgi:hypothetical protein
MIYLRRQMTTYVYLEIVYTYRQQANNAYLRIYRSSLQNGTLVYSHADKVKPDGCYCCACISSGAVVQVRVHTFAVSVLISYMVYYGM